jgi:hypothetical protein
MSVDEPGAHGCWCGRRYNSAMSVVEGVVDLWMYPVQGLQAADTPHALLTLLPEVMVKRRPKGS